MNGDISLSQALGGLRIANPDADVDSPSPPPTTDMNAASVPRVTSPPSSQSSSSSTFTGRRRANTAVPESTSALPHGTAPQGLDPPSFTNTPLRHSLIPRRDDAIHDSYFSRRPTSVPMPLPHKAQQALHFPPSSQSLPRPYHSPNALSLRPTSTLFNHANPSGTSVATLNHGYRYETVPTAEPLNVGVSRAPSTRKSAASVQAAQAGVVSRDSQYTDRQYLVSSAMHGGNGPAPPRRSSRQILPTNLQPPGAVVPSLSTSLSTSPIIEGAPLPSSEEWKERGAAVGVRQEVDQNGQIVSRTMKKGVNDFTFGRTLGEGSYSTVLAAKDRQTGRDYAIKVLDKRHIIKEKKVKYVNIEKDTLNRLTDHPGVVRLYYTFQDERSLYFVLDLAAGGELLGVLKQYTTFDEECTRFYGAQILDTIEYMHQQGIIHRDLKPENVLMDLHMHVKITDFGTAKILEKPASNGVGLPLDKPLDGAESDRANSFVGTAEYVSPELLTDKSACKASDLWAFGCIIYQLLAGRPPFKASNEFQTFQKIVALDYVFPDTFPEVARDLVERLLVLDPSRRLPIEHIKNHEFFDGITWGKGLWKQDAPRLKSYAPRAHDPIKLNGPTSASASSRDALRPNPRLITELPPPSQLDIDWSPVLTRNNERILKLGNMYVTSSPAPHSPGGKNGEPAKIETPNKFQRFFGASTLKRRQRLVMVTSSGHLVMAAAGGEEKKAKMDINLLSPGCSWKNYQDARGMTVWCLDTKDKHFIFEDPKASTSDPAGSVFSTDEWLASLAQARDFARSQSTLNNSYSGESALTLNDLASTISSPSSTLGLGEQIEGVNVPFTGGRVHLRKKDKKGALGGDVDDDQSVRSLNLKGMKRFSRRHSKNPLAAVF